MAILFISEGFSEITFISIPTFLTVVYTSTAKLSGLGRDNLLFVQDNLSPLQLEQSEQQVWFNRKALGYPPKNISRSAESSLLVISFDQSEG